MKKGTKKRRFVGFCARRQMPPVVHALALALVEEERRAGDGSLSQRAMSIINAIGANGWDVMFAKGDDTRLVLDKTPSVLRSPPRPPHSPPPLRRPAPEADRLSPQDVAAIVAKYDKRVRETQSLPPSILSDPVRRARVLPEGKHVARTERRRPRS